MLTEQRRSTPAENRAYRMTLGAWLRQLREGQGLSQRDLADKLALDHYTFISQVENGRGRIPTHRYVEWAQALGQCPKDFTKTLLSYYEPTTYRLLFDDAVGSIRTVASRVTQRHESTKPKYHVRPL